MDQARFYAAYFAHQHHIVWDIMARDTILPVAYLALIIAALAIRNRTGPGRPEGQFLVILFLVGGILSIVADRPSSPPTPSPSALRPAHTPVATVEGIQTLTHWPEAFGFVVLAGGLVALGRLCGSDRVFPASLGALAYLEAVLLLGIAVTGLIPNDAGYNWLSLAAGAVVGPALSIWLGTRLGRPWTQAAT